jgi:hypothetical protein
VLALLSLVESVRYRLNDFGGDRGAPSAGYYARWQEDDSTCLWKNAEIVAYLKRALRDVSDRAPWEDESATVDFAGSIHRPIVGGSAAEIEIGASIMAVESVRLASSGLSLTKTESARLTAEKGEGWAAETGTPTHYYEPRNGALRLYPIPVLADSLLLRVRRRALDEFEWADVATESAPSFSFYDVPDDLEEALVAAVCRQAYLKRDADTYNPNLARDHEKMLLDLLGPPVSRRQREARRYNANLSVAIRPTAPRARADTRFEDD